MDFVEIARKWQKIWKEKKTYKVIEENDQKSFYILDMFPYPSGAGLHVGHPKGYIATDVIARKHMLQGEKVLHPMGFDTFGLGTEQYAIANKMKPQAAAAQNIATYKKQLGMFGCTYDRDREVNTADPKYFKWTQKTFLDLYNSYFDEVEQKAKPISELKNKLQSLHTGHIIQGELTDEEKINRYLDSQRLAYVDYKPINRCPSCKTGLANEDLNSDGTCERCGSLVEQKPMKQWVIRITKYAERLLAGLDNLPDRSDSTKDQQRNWIGKSEGTQFEMKMDGLNEKFEVYTTRVDTVFGMSFVVMAPEHKLVDKITTSEYKKSVEEYKEAAKHKTQLERTELQKEKTGVFTGAYAINPFNGDKIPVYVGDYVLANYGTGVVMAVPAHDERDFEFAKKYDLEIKQSIGPVFGENKDNEIDKLSGYGLIHDPKTDKYLIIEKSDGEDWGDFSLPGGTIENGETLLEGTLREVKEETGYKNLKIKYEPIYAQAHYFTIRKNIQRLNNAFCFFFELENKDQDEQELTEFEKTLRYKWLTLDEIKKSFKHDVWNFFVDHLINPGAYTEKGVLINSGEFDGLKSDEAIEKMQEWLEENNIGGKKVNYRLQDRVFSRQRYRGEPIPMIHCEKCGIVPLELKDLPLQLPDVENYEPTGTEDGPLADIDDWINVKCSKCGGDAKRESNTMPGWAGSSWYWMRYMDPNNENELVSPEKEKFWHPVDIYVGGAEHITRHMIYARFWHKFLQDLGVVSVAEPFKKYQHVGLIMAEDGRKMSKRRGNVINPDDIINEFGSDTLRMYEMFMGPFDQAVNWNTSGVKGIKKFLDRVVTLYEKVDNNIQDDKKILNILHKTIKKVTEDIDKFGFNTAISQMMILVNELTTQNSISKSTFEILIILLAPFAPHLAEEFWEKLGNKFSIFSQNLWPKYDEKYLVQETIVMAVQINGKVRGTIEISPDAFQDDAMALVKGDEKISKHIFSEPKKIIYLKGKILNIVV